MLAIFGPMGPRGACSAKHIRDGLFRSVAAPQGLAGSGLLCWPATVVKVNGPLGREEMLIFSDLLCLTEVFLVLQLFYGVRYHAVVTCLRLVSLASWIRSVNWVQSWLL